MKWYGLPPKPSARIEKVRGKAVPLQVVRGPMDGYEAVVIRTTLATRGLFRTHLVPIITAHDFLLEADDGRSFVVEARDLVLTFGWSMEHLSLGWSTMEPVRSLLPASMLDKLSGTPLRPPAALRYREAGVPPGKRVEVRGVIRELPAPPGLPGASYRVQGTIPTLTGGGGRVEVRFLSVARPSPYSVLVRPDAREVFTSRPTARG